MTVAMFLPNQTSEPTPDLVSQLQSLMAPLAGLFPSWLQPLVLIGLAALATAIISGKFFKVFPLIWRAVQQLQPKGDRRRAEQRGRFASSIANQISIISQQEEWRDERFTELEAEVEVHGRPRRGLLSRRRSETLRRMPSLSAALEKNREQIILLEGPPGSGKSVALRHLAIRVATRLKNRPSESGVLPVYVNLKEFRPTTPVDAEAVRTFVKASMNRANDRYVERFVEEEFDRGIEEGTWLFLFDSFDEIPSILGATEADDIIEQYATAIYSFLTGLHDCRGIIASREFRGPKRITWPRFQILNLNERQRLELISRLDLPKTVESRIITELFDADEAIRQLADSPLFLALLCEHQRDSGTFPSGSHMVFENYVAKRFEVDSARIRKRFNVSSATVRRVAEEVAYCMAATPGLGLSPSRRALASAMSAAGFAMDGRLDVALDALEYLRLARPVESVGGDHKEFTFAHRRFQEYFCTCLVLQDGSRADSTRLLTDGRWRETSVTLLQTGEPSALDPLLLTASRILASMTKQLQKLGEAEPDNDLKFRWPDGSLHLLGVFQAAFPPNDKRMPDALRQDFGTILRCAFDCGELHDKRWAVELCTAADNETSLHILRAAFASDSSWLQEAAYANVGKIYNVPSDLRLQMRRLLAGLAAGGQLRRQSQAVSARLSRLVKPEPEQRFRRFFIATPAIDAVAWVTIMCAVLISPRIPTNFISVGILLPVFAHLMIYVLRDTRRLQWEARFTGGAAWLYSSLAGLFGPVSSSLADTMFSFMRVYVGAILGTVFWQYEIPISLACWYITVWGVAAVHADEVVDTPTIWQLLILPILYPAALFRKHVLPAFKKGISGAQFLRGGAIVAASIFMAAVVFWSIDFLSQFLNGWLVRVAAFLSFGGFLAIIFRNVHRRISDHKLLRAYESGNIQLDTSFALLSFMGKFGTDRGLILFLEEFKRQRPAVGNSSMLVALSDAASAVERLRIKGQVSKDEVATSQDDEIDAWKKSLPFHARKVLRANASIIRDEFGKMLADAALRRP